MEFKAGNIGREALDQLKKDRHALRDGWTIEWYTVEGAKVDKEVQEKIRELQSRFPERFRIITVTREQMMRERKQGQRKPLPTRRGNERNINSANVNAPNANVRADTEATSAGNIDPPLCRIRLPNPGTLRRGSLPGSRREMWGNPNSPARSVVPQS